MPRKRKPQFDIKKFKKFENKIIYLIHDEIPKEIEEIKNQDSEGIKSRKIITNAHLRENGQRNFIYSGLQKADDEDLILISDVDEIPNFKSIRFIRMVLRDFEEPIVLRLATLDESVTEKPAELISFQRRDPSFLLNWSLIGYCISKYRMEGKNPVYMYSRVVFARNFRDPHVAYGKKYRYEIRPVYSRYVHEHSDQLVILASDESASIDIDCKELKVPSPSENFATFIGTPHFSPNSL